MATLVAEDGRKNYCGERFRELRRKRGLSQEALMADFQLLGFDKERGVIKRIENGTRAVSDVELRLIAKYFGVSYRYLIDGVADEE